MPGSLRRAVCCLSIHACRAAPPPPVPRHRHAAPAATACASPPCASPASATTANTCPSSTWCRTSGRAEGVGRGRRGRPSLSSSLGRPPGPEQPCASVLCQLSRMMRRVRGSDFLASQPAMAPPLPPTCPPAKLCSSATVPAKGARTATGAGGGAAGERVGGRARPRPERLNAGRASAHRHQAEEQGGQAGGGMLDEHWSWDGSKGQGTAASATTKWQACRWPAAQTARRAARRLHAPPPVHPPTRVLHLHGFDHHQGVSLCNALASGHKHLHGEWQAPQCPAFQNRHASHATDRSTNLL